MPDFSVKVAPGVLLLDVYPHTVGAHGKEPVGDPIYPGSPGSFIAYIFNMSGSERAVEAWDNSDAKQQKVTIGRFQSAVVKFKDDVRVQADPGTQLAVIIGQQPS